MARRLQGRLDRHQWLLDRMRSEPGQGDPPELSELLETAGRMRRDAESLLLLHGQDPAARTGGARRLSEVLGDAASAAEEPRRVDIRTAPAATVSAGASIEFLHVLAELVDHAAAVYPGARVDMASRLEAGGGLTVDVWVDGVTRTDPDDVVGRRAAAAAERLALRSRFGIDLRRPLSGSPRDGSGLVASVYCPAAVITVDEPVPASTGELTGRNGNGHGRPSPALVTGPAVTPPYLPSTSSQVDELFGPLIDLPIEPMDDRFATPIFEAIASVWFREGEPEPADATGHAAPVDWESPSDAEWRAAADRAARAEEAPLLSTGLPRRLPGDQLVPPSRRRGAAPDVTETPERVPDRVRDRLSTYQRGLRQGRHRAPSGDGPERDGW